MALFAQMSGDFLLQWKSRVIGADRNLHAPMATFLANISLATLTIASGVNPNFFCSSFSGADAPNVFMPMRAPGLCTYCAQPYVDACSTEIRFSTDDGNTLSL